MSGWQTEMGRSRSAECFIARPHPKCRDPSRPDIFLLIHWCRDVREIATTYTWIESLRRKVPRYLTTNRSEWKCTGRKQRIGYTSSFNFIRHFSLSIYGRIEGNFLLPESNRNKCNKCLHLGNKFGKEKHGNRRRLPICIICWKREKERNVQRHFPSFIFSRRPQIIRDTQPELEAEPFRRIFRLRISSDD